jgi:hypothetical protein
LAVRLLAVVSQNVYNWYFAPRSQAREILRM